VGYGVCRMGAAFGFQDHPNVEVVAVSDLIPERCGDLMKACRCPKSYESLEVLVQDPKIEAVFVATDAPSHAQHCLDALNHGKHVMTCVPATYGSVEHAQQLVETVQKTGLTYMRWPNELVSRRLLRDAEDLSSGRVWAAGVFRGRVLSLLPNAHRFLQGLANRTAAAVVSEHSTAYYVGVTGKRFTSVSGCGFAEQSRRFSPVP